MSGEESERRKRRISGEQEGFTQSLLTGLAPRRRHKFGRFALHAIVPLVAAPSVVLGVLASLALLPATWHGNGEPTELGMLQVVNGSTVVICPRWSICSEGPLQIGLLALSRLTAFLLYVPTCIVFFTGCHSLLTMLRGTLISTFIPLECFQTDLHFVMGRLFLVYATLHTAGHLMRWALRGELSMLVHSQVGCTGILAIGTLLAVVAAHSRLSAWLKWSWETRMNMHYLFVIVAIACMLHTPNEFRLGGVMLAAVGMVCLDKFVTVIFRTHRIDSTLFTRLDDGTVQLEWEASSLPDSLRKVSLQSYVRIMVPWLPRGGWQMHPFSLFTGLDDNADVSSLSTVDYDEANGRAGTLSTSLTDSLAELEASAISTAPPNRSRHWSVLKSALRLRGNERVDSEQESEHSAGLEHQPLICARSTSAILIFPAGDWTKLLSSVVKRPTTRSCWIQGPFASSLVGVHEYDNLLLFTTGSAISTALTTILQWADSRNIYLVWSTRSISQIRFFMKLIRRARGVFIYYTGKDSSSQLPPRMLPNNCVLINGRPSPPHIMTAIILGSELKGRLRTETVFKEVWPSRDRNHTRVAPDLYPEMNPGPAESVCSYATPRELLVRLCYVSIGEPGVAECLPAIVKLSKRKNEAKKVTGVLYFVRATSMIIQILEGPSSAVDAIFERIHKDTRHSHVRVLERYALVARSRSHKHGMLLATFLSSAPASLAPTSKLSMRAIRNGLAGVDLEALSTWCVRYCGSNADVRAAVCESAGRWGVEVATESFDVSA